MCIYKVILTSGCAMMVEDGAWSGRIRTGKVTSTEQTTTATCCITENTITKLTWFLIKSALSSVVATESWFQPWLKGGAREREREKSLANSANFSLGSCTLVARAPQAVSSHHQALAFSKHRAVLWPCRSCWLRLYFSETAAALSAQRFRTPWKFYTGT